MIEGTIREAADGFVQALAANAVVNALQKAKAGMEGDGTLAVLRDQYARMVEQFQRRQFEGNLAQEDIAELRKLQKQVTTHPINIRFAEARDEALELLSSCNEIISNLLGFNFAANAAPPAAAC